MSVTGLRGRDQGGWHQSQDSKGLRLCPESNEDSLKGFKQLNDRVITHIQTDISGSCMGKGWERRLEIREPHCWLKTSSLPRNA